MAERTVSKGKRTAAARAARAAAARVAARRRERRRRLRTLGAGAAIATVVAAGIGVQVWRSDTGGERAVPAGVVETYGLLAGSRDAPVRIDVYQDYLCPACRQFEATAGPLLEQLAGDGQARVVYHPIAFLDRYSTTRYSTRAANAVGCAADASASTSTSTSTALIMQERLYDAQPPGGGPGLSDDRLIQLGRAAGASGGAFESCVRDQVYRGWTREATDAASKAGVVRTPTVLVDGEELPVPSVQALRAAVGAARAD